MPRGMVPKCDVGSVYARLKDESTDREFRYRRALAHYRAWPPSGLRPWEFNGGGEFETLVEPNRYKIIWAIVQTLLSRHAATRPAPKVVTNGAKESLQTQAKLLESLLLGVMSANKFYSLLHYQLRDCLLFGFGTLKAYLSGCKTRVKLKQVRPWDLFFTASKSAVFERMFVDRDELAELYPDKRGLIMAASRVSAGEGDDLVEVVDYYKSGVEHVVHLVGEDKPILVEGWPWEHPYTVLYSEEDFCGPYPPAFVDQLIPIQEEMNFVTSRIQRYYDQFGTTYIVSERGSGVPVEQLAERKDAVVILYDGQPPQVVTGPAVSSEAWKYEDHLNARLFQVSGVSQMAAQGLKPAGIESGIALRTLNDIENQKFAILSRNIVDAVVDAGRRIIECAKRGSISVRHADALRFTEIKWSDINLDEQDYILQVASSSHLPQEPSAKYQMVQEMLQGGMIEVSEAREMLEMPDLESYETLANASYNSIKEDIEQMVATGEFIPPSKYTELGTAKKLAVRYRALYRREERARDLLEKYIDEVILLESLVRQDEAVVKQVAGKGPLAGPQVTFQDRRSPNEQPIPAPIPGPGAAPGPGPIPGPGPAPGPIPGGDAPV